MLPPGFPAMLALLQLAFGESHVRLVRIMVIVTMISLLVAYFLLRRTLRKQTAAGICLLLASSAAFFQFASTFVFSDMPYFLTSMAALLVVDRLDRDRNRGRHRSLLLCLAALLICVSLLIRTSGLALVLGIVVWVAATLWFNRARGLFRLRTFGALVVCGLVVQVAWSAWAAHYRVDEWPTGGYPKPYLAQLTVKNGNEPELGFASLADIPARITQNVTDRAAALDYLLTAKTGNRLITARWFLPWIFGPVALVVLGLIRSIRRSGGTLAEWYFIVHEAIYLIWPWDFEMRFFLPVAPLACLYAWRGAQGCLTLLRRRRKWSGPVVRRRLEAFAFVLLCALLVNGLVHQIDVARKNRAFELSNTASYPDIVAAEWINAHVPPGAVIMARLWDVA
jgi:4-amino-4-deoxy-L-arabinose transferase-like glycosyltransferase